MPRTATSERIGPSSATGLASVGHCLCEAEVHAPCCWDCGGTSVVHEPAHRNVLEDMETARWEAEKQITLEQPAQAIVRHAQDPGRSKSTLDFPEPETDHEVIVVVAVTSFGRFTKVRADVERTVAEAMQAQFGGRARVGRSLSALPVPVEWRRR